MEQMEELTTVMRKVDCPFCQSTLIVETTQGETAEQLADKAAMACSCVQSADWRRERRIREKLVNDLQDRRAVNGIMSLVDLIREGLIDKASIKYGEIKYDLSTNTDNVLKFKRSVSKKEEMVI